MAEDREGRQEQAIRCSAMPGSFAPKTPVAAPCSPKKAILMVGPEGPSQRVRQVMEIIQNTPDLLELFIFRDVTGVLSSKAEDGQ